MNLTVLTQLLQQLASHHPQGFRFRISDVAPGVPSVALFLVDNYPSLTFSRNGVRYVARIESQYDEARCVHDMLCFRPQNWDPAPITPEEIQMHLSMHDDCGEDYSGIWG